MITVFAPEDAFAPEVEPMLLARLHGALAAAVDATDNPELSNIIGVALHVLPKARYTLGGVPATGVTIDVTLPAVALSTFRRRRRFIEDATRIVADLASEGAIRDRIHVQVKHLVDGGFGIGGVTLTNDFLDEGPE
jgi:hypothetical protein